MADEVTAENDEEILGPCCRIFLCCEPPQAARALARHEGIPLDAAAKILKGYQLVPKTLEAGPGPTDPERVSLARRRLVRLQERNQNELQAILLDLGYGVEPAG